MHVVHAYMWCCTCPDRSPLAVLCCGVSNAFYPPPVACQQELSDQLQQKQMRLAYMMLCCADHPCAVSCCAVLCPAVTCPPAPPHTHTPPHRSCLNSS
jgi:hypothetical protein